MNPKIDDKMNWKDYSSTAAQWLAILGGAVWAVLGGMGIAPGGPLPGISLSLTGLAGGKKGSILEDMVSGIAKGLKGKTTMLLSIGIMLMLGVSACSGDHPLLRADSRKAVMEVASPYIMSDCSAIEFYAGYRFDWSEVDPTGDPDFLHGFGGIVGGCDKFAKVACNIVQQCNDAKECTEKVVCEVVQVLSPVKDGEAEG